MGVLHPLAAAGALAVSIALAAPSVAAAQETPESGTTSSSVAPAPESTSSETPAPAAETPAEEPAEEEAQTASGADDQALQEEQVDALVERLFGPSKDLSWPKWLGKRVVRAAARRWAGRNK